MALIFAIFFIVFAVIFIMGKGDKLIAGYNTASEEERQKVNIKRLRLLMAGISIFTACFCAVLPIFGKNSNVAIGASMALIAATIIVVILANTWARKK